MSILEVINGILLFYVLPLITSYLFAKFYFKNLSEYIYDPPSVLTIIAILCPIINIIFTGIWLVAGTMEWFDNADLEKKKGGRTVGERFLRMKKERR